MFDLNTGGGGGNSWWRCAALFSKSWVTRFQTKKCHSLHPFSDLAFRQKLCYYFIAVKPARLRSRLIQVAYVTSQGCPCPKPASFEMFRCKYVCVYITAFASISRSTALEIEALSFAVNRLRTVRTQMKCDVENLSPGEILFGIESHVFASEEYECKWS